MKLDNVNGSINPLIERLGKIQTQSSYEKTYIGMAISHLLLLQDLLSETKQQPIKKEIYPKAYVTLGVNGKWIFTDEKLDATSKLVYID